MLDDLRDDASFVEEDSEPDSEYQGTPSAGTQTQFLGMTPVQRFVLAFMILMMTCILGSFFLLITETVWLSF